jgi:hypothetical protein
MFTAHNLIAGTPGAGRKARTALIFGASGDGPGFPTNLLRS